MKLTDHFWLSEFTESQTATRHGIDNAPSPEIIQHLRHTAEQMDAVRSKGKRAFIAGATVSGNVPENWEHAVNVGIDGILTDYPFELAAMLRKNK